MFPSSMFIISMYWIGSVSSNYFEIKFVDWNYNRSNFSLWYSLFNFFLDLSHYYFLPPLISILFSFCMFICFSFHKLIMTYGIAACKSALFHIMMCYFCTYNVENGRISFFNDWITLHWMNITLLSIYPSMDTLVILCLNYWQECCKIQKCKYFVLRC